MRSVLIAAAAMALVVSACASGGSNTRTILIDHSSDRYSNYSLYYFPNKIAVHPGTTLVFRQTWTGEPHTVTGGVSLNGVLQSSKAFGDLFADYEYLAGHGADLPDPNSPDSNGVKFTAFVAALKAATPADRRDALINAYNTLRERGVPLPDLDHPPAGATFGDVNKAVNDASNKIFAQLPSAFPNDNSNALNQNYSQPCYLRTGLPPSDPKKACTKAQQKQPDFDGTNSFYSSGIIPYSGTTGNTFKIPLSNNIKPGKYVFFCAVHGPLQSVEVDVRPNSEKIPSEAQDTSEAQKQIEEHNKPLDALYAQAVHDKVTIDLGGGQKSTLSGPFAGVQTIAEQHAAIADMLPKVFTAKAGQPITWKMMGGQHTISFGVPPYFPPVQFLKDGTVRLNPELAPPRGGAPTPPAAVLNDESNNGGSGGVVKIDGGTYSGNGFWSSGFIGSDPYIEYTLRIAKPGRYRYACLLHPSMVGTVVITP